ncbi:MAG: hypothetical protein LC798_10735 [Chloroflexi bacterium]|nr:hypothetical protein [Chloroflexota bacterium]
MLGLSRTLVSRGRYPKDRREIRLAYTPRTWMVGASWDIDAFSGHIEARLGPLGLTIWWSR